LESAIFGLIGVVVGALLTTAKDWWFEYRRRRKNLEYLSIRVVSIFDHFVAVCIEACRDDGLAHGSRDEQGCKVPQVDTPKLELSAIDVDWKSLPSNLMYEILNFPTLVDNANSYISSIVEFVAGPPDYDEFFEGRVEEYSELGLRAMEISTTLRKLCNLPDPIENEEGWSRKELLNKYKSEAIESIERRNRSNLEVLSDLESNINNA
jgi:hypothetical protein